MPFSPQKKKSVLVPSGETLHLFVIVTDACKNMLHLLVPICTIKKERYYDKTCIVKVGDHPFIKHDSYVYYAQIQQRPQAHIIKCVDENSYIEKEDVGDALYAAICAGIEKSSHIPRWAKSQYKSWPNS